jgi:putative radical SAM enzyme (TIGR03279 family)
MKIISVQKGSQADLNGVKAGDKLALIDGNPIRDYIDLMYYGSEEEMRITVHRGSYEINALFRGDEDFGLDFEPMDIKTCKNNCVFCFVNQNPPEMRKQLYIKDEDYRLSFLHGAYVTLAGLDMNDLQRIVKQHLSPLYISVHALDLPTRLKLLGIKRDDRLIENMDTLLTAGIKLHTQVVVCPGINDGAVLEKTIRGLHDRSPGVLSLAVVPVGLTKHREGRYPLDAVDVNHAREIIELVEQCNDEFMRDSFDGFVYCADELYIRAGRDIPAADYYHGFPQIENGVGMLRDFLDATADIGERLSGNVSYPGKYVFVTGTSMAPYIEDIAVRISEIPGVNVRAMPVENNFYGDSIIVSGLLTGADIQSALTNVSPDETVVLPPNCLNDSGVFLDGISPADISGALGVNVTSGEYDPLNIFM